MSSAADRSGRIRRREEEEEEKDAPQATEVAQPGPQPNDEAVGAAINDSRVDSSSLTAPPQPSAEVQPLPEQIGKRPRLSCGLHSLADVELQLVMQFLDNDSKLKAARCSRQLLHAASAPFAWRSAPLFVVTARSAADVERIQTSLLRFVSIHLRFDWPESLECKAPVPNVAGLDLLETHFPMPQLLRHPNSVHLQSTRPDSQASDTMRLILDLPQLRALELAVPRGAGAALLQPLAAAPALTHLTFDFNFWQSDEAMMTTIGGCIGLRTSTMGLRRLFISSALFLTLCSASTIRRLQHLELVGCHASSGGAGAYQPRQTDDYRAAFSALEQLQSLTMEKVNGADALLPHLHLAPALRLLSIRCGPSRDDIGVPQSPLPRRDVLSALLTAAPQLEVRLLMAATLDRWLGRLRSAVGSHHPMFEYQWRQMQRAAAEMERVTIVDEEPSSA